jgi:carboxypeptidase C (cathepsin A)
MNKIFNLKASLIVAAMLVLPVAHAATMTKADYKAAKTRISAEYKADKAACASFADNARDICVEQAKGKEKVARAELEYGYTAKASDQNKVLVAKAESTYAVAKEKCDDKAGNDKDVCVKEAKAIEVKALVDARMGKQIGEAKMDAAEDKRDADYNVATQKCDALSGDAKASCMAAAKAKFGKS